MMSWFERRVRDLPIAAKMAWLLTATSVAALTVVFCTLTAYEVMSFRKAKAEKISALADLVAANSKAALAFGDGERSRQNLEALREVKSVVQAYVFDSRWAMHAVFQRDANTPRTVAPPARQPGVYEESRAIVVYRPILLDGDTIGMVCVRASLDEMYARLKNYLWVIAAISLIALCSVSLVLAALRRLISQPVLSLAQAARQFSQRDYTVRAEKHCNDEIGDAVDAFNELAGEVAARTKSLLDLNQELTEARHRADEGARLKSEFLANVSHEIRTPMNGILGMTELALQTELSTEQRDYLQTARDSADSLLELIDSVLDLSKIEAGKFEVECTTIDLNELLERTTRMVAVRAHQKQLELTWRLEPGTPSMIAGDPVRIRQVLLNLLGNAIKFTHAGQVALSVSCESMSAEQINLCFSVCDTGIGIRAEHQRRIFEAFTQADGSTTRNYGGSGLGLAICGRLVELMGGRIWVESWPGRGSTFRFTIAAKPTDIGPDSQPWSAASGIRALVVDDNVTNLATMSELLEGWGMALSTAHSGEDALLTLRSGGGPFGLVLIDNAMPGMTGFDFAAKARLEGVEARRMVMMVSSIDLQQSAARCRDLGVAQYLVKPVSTSALQQAAREVIGSGPSRPVVTPGAIISTTVDRDLRSLSILLAEDNMVNQKLAERILTKAGHKVCLVSDGKQAVDRYSSENYDIVLMDIQMPVLDGLAATRAIREVEQREGRYTPVVALTAHALDGDRERCVAAGMDGYVTKPLRVPELLRAISAAMAAQSEVSISAAGE